MKVKWTFALVIFFNSSFVFAHVNNVSPQTIQENNNVNLVKKMFSDFAEKRDINTLDQYYSKTFVLISNHKNYDYSVYKRQQRDIFQKLKSLQVLSYDDIFAKDNKVVSRMTIRLIMKNGDAHTFYVIFIALIHDKKIVRLWEITYPSWSDKLER